MELKIENDSLKNENQLLKNKINLLKKEIDNLKIKLDQLSYVKDEEIKELYKKHKKLNDEKMKIANDLILKMKNNVALGPYFINNALSYGEKLIAINFISVDQNINHSIICKNKTKFIEVERELYLNYPQYSRNNNCFIFNGLQINRLKTLEENGIHGYTIVLNKIKN